MLFELKKTVMRNIKRKAIQNEIAEIRALWTNSSKLRPFFRWDLR